MSKVVYISPSNQVSNQYTGVNTTECAEMEKIGAYLKYHLSRHGVECIIPLRQTSITNRSKQANELKPDVYLAIHSNAAGTKNDGSIQGSEVWYNPNNANSTRLASLVNTSISQVTPTKDRGLKPTTSLVEINTPKYPIANILVEVEFHDNETLSKWICNNHEKIAIGLCKGILRYLEIDYIENREIVYEPGDLITVTKAVAGYYTADNAIARTDRRTVLVPGKYYIYKVHKSAINLTMIKNIAGSWVNTLDL